MFGLFSHICWVRFATPVQVVSLQPQVRRSMHMVNSKTCIHTLSSYSAAVLWSESAWTMNGLEPAASCTEALPPQYHGRTHGLPIMQTLPYHIVDTPFRLPRASLLLSVPKLVAWKESALFIVHNMLLHSSTRYCPQHSGQDGSFREPSSSCLVFLMCSVARVLDR